MCVGRPPPPPPVVVVVVIMVVVLLVVVVVVASYKTCTGASHDDVVRVKDRQMISIDREIR